MEEHLDYKNKSIIMLWDTLTKDHQQDFDWRRHKLYSLNVSSFNNKPLVIKEIKQTIKKVGRKFYNQFYNTAFYKGLYMTNLAKKYKGISWFGKQEIQKLIDQLKTFDLF